MKIYYSPRQHAKLLVSSMVFLGLFLFGEYYAFRESNLEMMLIATIGSIISVVASIICARAVHRNISSNSPQIIIDESGIILNTRGISINWNIVDSMQVRDI